jgi:hypothetical protein
MAPRRGRMGIRRHMRDHDMFMLPGRHPFCKRHVAWGNRVLKQNGLDQKLCILDGRGESEEP